MNFPFDVYHRLSFYLFWVKFSKKWKIIPQKIKTMKVYCYKFHWLIVTRINVNWKFSISFRKSFFLNFPFCVQHAHFIIDSFFSNIIFEKCKIIPPKVNTAHIVYISSLALCLWLSTINVELSEYFLALDQTNGSLSYSKWYSADCIVDYEIS